MSEQPESREEQEEQEDEDLVCRACGSEFADEEELEQHAQEKHA